MLVTFSIISRPLRKYTRNRRRWYGYPRLFHFCDKFAVYANQNPNLHYTDPFWYIICLDFHLYSVMQIDVLYFVPTKSSKCQRRIYARWVIRCYNSLCLISSKDREYVAWLSKKLDMISLNGWEFLFLSSKTGDTLLEQNIWWAKCVINTSTG